MEETQIANTLTKVENDSSIEITKNTKGFTYSVKAYGGTTEQIKSKLEELMNTTLETIKKFGGQ